MYLKFIVAIFSVILMLNVQSADAAAIDDELSILAAEQEDQGDVEVFMPEGAEDTPKTKKELREEKKRLEEEREAARKKIKEERNKARDEVAGKKPASKNPAPAERTSPSTQRVETKKPSAVETPNVEVETSPVVETPPVEQEIVGMPNPIVEYNTFEEMVAALNFTPLYIPKKSGYTINAMATIGGNLGEIRYGRRWEPEVSLHVRTYKRSVNEELRDISGIYGVKWRIDKTSGSTIYIAKIDDNSHVAAWASGNYTFSAYVQNLSFAAFHTIVADELVDLSNHYYLG